MKVDRATVRHIASLARIRVSEDDAARLEGELSGILEWVEQLGEVETAGVEPMTSAVATTMKQRADHYFVVPKVVE